GVPIGLRRKVITNPFGAPVAVFAVGILGTHLVLRVTYSITTQFENIFSIAELTETVERRANRIERISTSQCLRNHIVDASNLYHCPDGTTGNDSSYLLRRLEENMLGTEQPMYLMRDRPGRKGNMHQVFFGLLDRLRDCHGHFGSLPFPDTDPPLSITDDNQRAEVEPLATLYNLRHSVDKDNLVLQAQFIWINSHLSSLLYVLLAPHHNGSEARSKTAGHLHAMPLPRL